ncbi:hypothetical protein C2W64_02449 [Brevibacillus laterosporus]|nr:hypothetical protein [Brevibacillus laterosporus]RAP24882.1 hypothetical protein C2W64_02449 [Brevibacillus laterosporus]
MIYNEQMMAQLKEKRKKDKDREKNKDEYVVKNVLAIWITAVAM